MIAALPERYRLALVAVDIAGLSYREAAGILETREATIATRVFRAREQVARRLTGRGRGGSRRGAHAGEQPTTGGEPSSKDSPAPGGAAHPRGWLHPCQRLSPSGKVSPPGGVLLNEVLT